MKSPVDNLPVRVAALYRFAHFEDPAAIKGPLLALCQELGIKGSLLLAKEGINGTVAGSESAIDAAISYIRTLPGCTEIDVKYSGALALPFNRMKVRLKKEIVTLGVDGVDPVNQVGTYLDPAEWNALISDPDTIIIDTRNDYEVEIGTFKRAIDPKTESFGQFPAWFEQNRTDLLHEGEEGHKPPKVAMFCTGGIRCEKSTAYLKSQGVDDVYHLKGGILRYLEEIDEQDSLWEGQCYVFDQRVAVGHGLSLSDYTSCHACGRPVSVEDKQSPEYIEGVACPRCKGVYSEEQRVRFAERHARMTSGAEGEDEDAQN